MPHRLSRGLDHIVVLGARIGVILGHRLAGDPERRPVQNTCCQQFAHYRSGRPCPLVILTQVLTSRLHVHHKWQVIADLLPLLDVQLDPSMAPYGREVYRRVGRPTNCRIHADYVVQRFLGDDLRWAEVFVRHLHDPFTGLVGGLHPCAPGRGDVAGAGQHHAQRLGQRVHGRSRAHSVAMAQRGRGGTDTGQELGIVDLARRQQTARFPDNHAGSSPLATPPAIQHRAAVQCNRGDVDSRRPHQHGGRGLVATSGQHHGVQRITL